MSFSCVADPLFPVRADVALGRAADHYRKSGHLTARCPTAMHAGAKPVLHTNANQICIRMQKFGSLSNHAQFPRSVAILAGEGRSTSVISVRFWLSDRRCGLRLDELAACAIDEAKRHLDGSLFVQTLGLSERPPYREVQHMTQRGLEAFGVAHARAPFQ